MNTRADWGWLPFPTADFAHVVPWISFSPIAAMVANVGAVTNVLAEATKPAAGEMKEGRWRFDDRTWSN